MIDDTWKPISSKTIIIRLTLTNKSSAWRHFVGIICTTSLYCENTLLSIKVKELVAASLLFSERPIIVFNWNHFEMRFLNLRINFFIYCKLFVLILVVFCCFFFHYVSAKFHLWPSSGDLQRPRIGMLTLVTVSPVITAFHSCCLSHHVFDQVNLWPAWVGIETAVDRGVESLRFQVSIVRR